MNMTAKRQLAAIMYCDIAGFSEMMYTDPALADEIRQRHHSALTESHKKYNGKIIQHFGDSTLSIFRSAAEAVECAYFLQLELRQNPEIPIRIGIHTGEIVQDEHGVYGEGLNVASRVERMADVGSILITDKVHDDIRSHPWISTLSLGVHKLDDLDREKELFVVTNRGLNVPPTPNERSSKPIKRNSFDEEELEPDEEMPFFDGKKKYVAAILAFFLGIFGAHRFYLGQRFKGFLYMIAFGIMMIISAEEHAPIVLFMLILSTIDAVLLAVMPKSEFDFKYNETWKNKLQTGRKNRKSRRIKSSFKLLKEAVNKFEAKQYQNAIILFDQLLDKDKRNAVAHFYLACCFSMLRTQKMDFTILRLPYNINLMIWIE